MIDCLLYIDIAYNALNLQYIGKDKLYSDLILTTDT